LCTVDVQDKGISMFMSQPYKRKYKNGKNVKMTTITHWHKHNLSSQERYFCFHWMHVPKSNYTPIKQNTLHACAE